jgi:hypothetical protein
VSQFDHVSQQDEAIDILQRTQQSVSLVATAQDIDRVARPEMQV